MATLSLCMIVKDEEAVLARCLDSAAGLYDELILVDTGSTDGTRALARRYTDKLFTFAWCDDFAAARNYAFAQATMDYLLWLDADDILPPESRDGLRALLGDLDVDVLLLPYHVGFDESGRPSFSYDRERVVRRSCGFVWREPVHEYIEAGGTYLHADIPVWHGAKHKEHDDRNLRIYRSREQAGEPFSTRALYYYARECQTHGLYIKAIVLYEAFRARGDGWLEDRISAQNGLSICHQCLGQPQRAKLALLESFMLDVPRAESCCRLGDCFWAEEAYRSAIFWYEMALTTPHDADRGFVNHEYRQYIPCLQLCLCHDRLGDREAAVYYNELAAVARPLSAAVAHNRAYFHTQAGNNLSAPAPEDCLSEGALCGEKCGLTEPPGFSPQPISQV